jgi:hypothetical protein
MSDLIDCTVEIRKFVWYVTFPADPKVAILLITEGERAAFIKACEGDSLTSPTEITKCPIDLFKNAKTQTEKWNKCPF